MAARPERSRPLPALTWLAWALAAAASIELAPNPLYVALVIAVAALVVQVHALDSPLARAFPALVGLGVAFALLRVVLTVATTHGTGHVLFTTPEATLPRLLGGFTVGGTVEAPVLLQAAAEGFAVVGLMAVFGAFNAVVSHYELVQAAPRAFYEPGLALTVALAFVPSTIATIQAAREGDRARSGGRVVRRGRLLRLAVPVLESGMERALALAESMDARGFGHLRPSPLDRAAGWCGLGSLVALGAGFVALVARARSAAILAGLVGVAALVAAVWLASGARRHPRYRARRLTPGEWGLSAAVLLAPAGLVAVSWIGGATLWWSAAGLSLPGFDGRAGLALAALALPAAVPRPPLASARSGS